MLEDIEFGFPSSALNSILAVWLEIFIVLFGQHIYHAWVNNRCRKQLMSDGSSEVYGRGQKYSWYITVALIFIVCESGELGFYGDSGEGIFRTLHPFVNLFRSEVSDWAAHERWEKQPTEIQLSDFPLLERRRRCIRPVRREGIEFVVYYAYGEEGCFDTIGRHNNRGIAESGLKVAEVGVNREDIEITIQDQVLDGIEDFGSVHFGGIEQTAVTFNVLWPFAGVNGLRTAKITFSMLQNQEYGSEGNGVRRNETISMVLWGTTRETLEFRNHFICFQVVPFSDVFVSPSITNTSLIMPKSRRLNISCFRIATFRATDQQISPRSEEEDARLTSRKVFYALSKLHFALEPNQSNNTSFITQLISEIDNHLYINSTGHTLRVRMYRYLPLHYHEISSVMLLWAISELNGVLILLILAKLMFLVKDFLAPISVNVFNTRYLAAVKLGDRDVLRKYNKEGYHVFMAQGVAGKLELKLEVEGGINISPLLPGHQNLILISQVIRDQMRRTQFLPQGWLKNHSGSTRG